ncbi:unnamed protein product [Urochloa humidicola]
MADDGTRQVALCCCGFGILSTLAIAGLLVAAYGFVVPVRVTVDAATLGSLALAAIVPANGTASFAYDVSLAVALRNRNWAMQASLTAPLVAELRFRGHAFARAQLAAGGDDRARIRSTAVYGMAGVAQSAPVALGPRDAAAFAKERAAGVFHLELTVSGQVKYEGHHRRHAIRVTCPLRLAPSSTAAPTAFARVRCA